MTQSLVQGIIDALSGSAVSYTHLDVYKRQGICRSTSKSGQ